jgi:hypothetical protein
MVMQIEHRKSYDWWIVMRWKKAVGMFNKLVLFIATQFAQNNAFACCQMCNSQMLLRGGGRLQKSV